MNRKIYLIAALMCLSIGFAFGQQPKSAKEAFAWWFDQNCGHGQEEDLKALIQFSEELMPMFITAFEAGPDPGWVDRLAESEMNMVRSNIAYVKKSNGEVAGLSREQVDAFNKMDVSAYEQQFRATITEGYKVTALGGLAATGSEKAKTYLAKVAKDLRNPNSATATSLLRNMSK